MGLDIRTSYPPLLRMRRRRCSLCQAGQNIMVEVPYTGTPPYPSVGELLTGLNSGATGIVYSINSAFITLSSVTGLDDNDWGIEGETATTPTASVTLAEVGIRKSNALSYPESDMVQEDGVWYCKWHHMWRFNNIRRDEAEFEIDDEYLESD